METSKRSTFGERLKAARKAAGMSQRDLGRLVGVTNAAVAHWENGQRREEGDGRLSEQTPHQKHLLPIAKALNVTVAQLTGEVDTDAMARTPREVDMLNTFRRMTPAQQDAYLAVFKANGAD